MAILVSQPFDASTQSPLDARCKQPSVVAALSALDSTRRTEGMLVWIEDAQQFYHFKGGTADSDFVVFASGSSSADTSTLPVAAWAYYDETFGTWSSVCRLAGPDGLPTTEERPLDTVLTLTCFGAPGSPGTPSTDAPIPASVIDGILAATGFPTSNSP